MSYAVTLIESVFPAQSDGVVRGLALGDQLRETAEQCPDKTGLVEVDIDGHIGRSWTYHELLADSEGLALAGRTRDRMVAEHARMGPDGVRLRARR